MRRWPSSPAPMPIAGSTGCSGCSFTDGLEAHPAVFTAAAPRPAIARSALPRVPARGRRARHPSRGDRLGRRAGGRHPGARPPAMSRPRSRPTSAPTTLVFGVAINGDVPRLSAAHPRLARDGQRRRRRRAGRARLLHALRRRHPVRGDGRGRERPSTFGSSGFLYRSNKLMYDRETGSLWNQFTGGPVAWVRLPAATSPSTSCRSS